MSQDVSGLSFSDRNRYDEEGNIRRVALLRLRGVEVWGPERVYVGPCVSLDRIEPGAVLKAAVITGESTWIGKGALIGTSGTAVIHDGQFGESVQVGAGFFEGATLLAGAKARGFAELRPGTLLEEDAEIAHNTGLKNTIFTAAVVAGSGINFCDLFMSGGCSRSDHSEVGSGAVHFNFDPRGDKFGSMIGDVRGVLLRSPRIFVGGHSGIVAPVHLDFGSLIPAGCAVRSDVCATQPYQIEVAQPTAAFDPGVYFDMKRKLVNTAKLVGNLHSFAMWYRTVRLPFAAKPERPLYGAALCRIQAHISHRIAELAKVMRKLDSLVSKGPQANPFFDQHSRIAGASREMEQWLTSPERPEPPPALVAEYKILRASRDHCDAVRALSGPVCHQTEAWLMRIPSTLVARINGLFA